MNITEFLHELRSQIIAEWHDDETIVRFEVDKDVKAENVNPIIICSGVYQPYRIDPDDEPNQALMDFCKPILKESIQLFRLNLLPRVDFESREL